MAGDETYRMRSAAPIAACRVRARAFEVARADDGGLGMAIA